MAQLEKLLKSKEELTGSITHEIKGLLSGIEGGIYLIRSGLEKNKVDWLEQGLEMVQRNLDRTRRIVGASLYYVKDRTIDWQPLEAKELLSSVQRELEPYATHLAIRLRLEDATGSFEADRMATFSILTNLATHAIEACNTAKMHATPTVTLSAASREDQVVFRILASGAVLEETTIQHALGDCYFPKGADRSHLASFVACKLAHQHGGTLRIEPNPEQGSTLFTVGFPLSRRSSVDSSPEADGTQDRFAKEWDR